MLAWNSPRVLAIGAHPDDIEIGAGGFISRLITEATARVTFLVLTPGLRVWRTDAPYRTVDRRREAEEAGKILGVETVCVLDLHDCELHNRGHEIIREIERLLYDNDRRPKFDLVVSHSGADTHTDHVQVNLSTMAAIRYFQGTLLLYQAPSTIPNAFKPNYFVSLTEECLDMKISAIAAHRSQSEKGREFMEPDRIRDMVESWSLFHRLPRQGLEAFELYKSFWPLNQPSATQS